MIGGGVGGARNCEIDASDGVCRGGDGDAADGKDGRFMPTMLAGGAVMAKPVTKTKTTMVATTVQWAMSAVKAMKT